MKVAKVDTPPSSQEVNPPSSQDLAGAEWGPETESLGDTDLSQSPPKPRRVCESQLKSDRRILNSFIKQVGVINFHFPHNCHSLKAVTKQKRISKTRQLLVKVIDTVCPDNSQHLDEQLLKPKHDI